MVPGAKVVEDLNEENKKVRGFVYAIRGGTESLTNVSAGAILFLALVCGVTINITGKP